MKRSARRIVERIGFFVVCMMIPVHAFAHEVYVLNATEIAHDIVQPPLNIFSAAITDEHQFILASFVGVFAVACILGISLSHRLERWIDPFLLKIKPYAGHITQITFGAALFASAHYGALFGIELPLVQLFGIHATLVTISLYIASLLVLTGIVPQIGAAIALVIFIGVVRTQGIYMLSYFTYLGEGLVILLFGGGYAFLNLKSPLVKHSHLWNAIAQRKHFLMRIFFSLSLIYAAFYAKLIHGTLALDTVTKYHLTNYFHFNPLFVVLGAFLTEISIALFYLLGFEIRFTSLFFLTFLTMSLAFFGEAVWPHIILIGTALSLFVHGYDQFSVERRFYIPGKSEPIL